MSDNKRGLYGKYIVRRSDGSSEPGKKHEACEYFVLDWAHDPFAIPAARAYADACADQYPALAADMYAMIRRRLPRAERPVGWMANDTTKPAILPPADLDDLRDRYVTRRIPDHCIEGAPDDVRALLSHIDALTAYVDTADDVAGEESGA